MATAALDEAGENRTQLEQVIGHYTNIDADPQKQETVYYLIANMEDKAGYAVADTMWYRLLLDSLAVLGDPIGWDPYLSTTSKWLDSMSTISPLRSGVRSDLKRITADYLIRNIDQAFEQWQRAPWAKDYTFEEFCEWVLPYRTDMNDRKHGDRQHWLWSAATKTPWANSAIRGIESCADQQYQDIL